MSTVSGSAFEFSLESTGGLWRWNVVSRNGGAGVYYEVSDVLTPWGSLYQTAIPIPADVVSEMASGISQIQQQLAPLLVLEDPDSVSFFVVITEGDPGLVVASVPFFNGGAFGSSLTATATPSAPWLRAEPGQASGLGKNDRGLFSVTLLTGSLLASGNPYLAVVNLQDNHVPSTVIPLAFSVSVLPRPTVAASPASLDFTWYQLTSTGTGPFSVTVSNSGPANSILNWSAARLHCTSPWIQFAPASGGPLASGGSETFSVSLVPSQIPAIPGVYQDPIRGYSSNSSNGYVDVPVVLTVQP